MVLGQGGQGWAGGERYFFYVRWGGGPRRGGQGERTNNGGGRGGGGGASGHRLRAMLAAARGPQVDPWSGAAGWEKRVLADFFFFMATGGGWSAGLGGGEPPPPRLGPGNGAPPNVPALICRRAGCQAEKFGFFPRRCGPRGFNPRERGAGPRVSRSPGAVTACHPAPRGGVPAPPAPVGPRGWDRGRGFLRAFPHPDG